MLLSKESKIIRRLLLVSIMIVTVTASYKSQSKTTVLESLKFSVLSARVMNENEALARTPHSVNADVVVRLRLSNDTNKGVYFLTFDGEMASIVPIGFNIQKSDKKIIWLHGRERKSEISPGVEKASSGLPTKWVILPPYTAVEWEVFDSTLYRNEQHAFTLFVKENETDKPLELMSEFFSIPMR